MKLEVGKTYVTEMGSVVKCTEEKNGEYKVGGCWYAENGWYGLSYFNSMDIVKEHKEENNK